MTQPSRIDFGGGYEAPEWDGITPPLRDAGPADPIRRENQPVRPSAKGRWEKIPTRFRAAQLADIDDPAIAADLADWSTASPPTNLVLFGPVGAGKTHAAVAACRRHVMDGADIEFAPTVELLDRLDWRRPDSSTYLERCCTVHLLVLDDIGTERVNEWTAERLYAVVNRRWLEGLPTVATTNVAPDRLAELVGDRLYSRLVGGAVTLALAGRDRRRQP